MYYQTSSNTSFPEAVPSPFLQATSDTPEEQETKKLPKKYSSNDERKQFLFRLFPGPADHPRESSSSLSLSFRVFSFFFFCHLSLKPQQTNSSRRWESSSSLAVVPTC